MVTGDMRPFPFGDLGKFKIPTLWGVKHTAPYFHHSGAKTLEEVLERVGATLDRIAAAGAEQDVVVVSHGAVMMAAYRHVTGSWPPAGRVVRNAGIVVVEHGDGFWRQTTEIPGNEEGPVG